MQATHQGDSQTYVIAIQSTGSVCTWRVQRDSWLLHRLRRRHHSTCAHVWCRIHCRVLLPVGSMCVPQRYHCHIQSACWPAGAWRTYAQAYDGHRDRLFSTLFLLRTKPTNCYVYLKRVQVAVTVCRLCISGCRVGERREHARGPPTTRGA